MILKTLISMLVCVWLRLKLNSAGNRISWTRFVDSCSKPGEMESWVILLQNSHYFINWCITLYILKPWVNVLDWIYALSLIGRTQNGTCLYNAHPIIYIASCSYYWVFSWMVFSVDYTGNNKTASSLLQFTCFHHMTFFCSYLIPSCFVIFRELHFICVRRGLFTPGKSTS